MKGFQKSVSYRQTYWLTYRHTDKVIHKGALLLKNGTAKKSKTLFITFFRFEVTLVTCVRKSFQGEDFWKVSCRFILFIWKLLSPYSTLFVNCLRSLGLEKKGAEGKRKGVVRIWKERDEERGRKGHHRYALLFHKLNIAVLWIRILFPNRIRVAKKHLNPYGNSHEDLPKSQDIFLKYNLF